MEFTKLLKHGSAVLFLILLTHGLVLGFSNSTTILAIVLAAVVCLFEAQLVKSERIENEKQLKNIVDELKHLVAKESEKHSQEKAQILKTMEADKVEMLERISSTHSQINAIKLGQGMKRL